jgi:hypothetical protein
MEEARGNEQKRQERCLGTRGEMRKAKEGQRLINQQEGVEVGNE